MAMNTTVTHTKYTTMSAKVPTTTRKRPRAMRMARGRAGDESRRGAAGKRQSFARATSTRGDPNVGGQAAQPGKRHKGRRLPPAPPNERSPAWAANASAEPTSAGGATRPRKTALRRVDRGHRDSRHEGQVSGGVRTSPAMAHVRQPPKDEEGRHRSRRPARPRGAGRLRSVNNSSTRSAIALPRGGEAPDHDHREDGALERRHRHEIPHSQAGAQGRDRRDHEEDDHGDRLALHSGPWARGRPRTARGPPRGRR